MAAANKLGDLIVSKKRESTVVGTIIADLEG